jgi:hypothetical protein
MAITLELKGADYTAEELRLVSGALCNPAAMNARIAGQTERWIKGPDAAGRVTAIRHRTATTLGAAPTNHLVKAYQQIEGQSDATSARLLIPGASLLASAFGPVTIVPKNGKRFLTIPAHREAYGRRAGEFPDKELFPVRVGPRKTLTLSRARDGGGLEVMYVLAAKATLPEDPTLIPFAELADEARDAVGDYIDDALEQTLTGGATP